MPTAKRAPAVKAKAKPSHPSQPAPSQGPSTSSIFVDPNGEPYKFYIKDLFPNWDEDAKKQLEDGITVRTCANRSTQNPTLFPLGKRRSSRSEGTSRGFCCR